MLKKTQMGNLLQCWSFLPSNYSHSIESRLKIVFLSQVFVSDVLLVFDLTSLSVSAPDTSSDAGGGRSIDILDDQLVNSGSESPPSATASEHQLPDKKDTSSPQNLDSYADIGMVQENSLSYAPSDSQQQQDPPELPSFSVSIIL